MVKYKVRISIDGDNFFWVIIENRKVINRNATREDLVKITTKTRFYNKTNICPVCRKENNITDNSILYPNNARRIFSKEGKRTDEYTCDMCGYRSIVYDPNNQKSIVNYPAQ